MDPPTPADLWDLLTDEDAWELAEATVRIVAQHAAGRSLPVDAWERE